MTTPPVLPGLKPEKSDLPPPLPAETTAEQNLRLVRELKARYPERVRALLARARAKLEAERTAK